MADPKIRGNYLVWYPFKRRTRFAATGPIVLQGESFTSSILAGKVSKVSFMIYVGGEILTFCEDGWKFDELPLVNDYKLALDPGSKRLAVNVLYSKHRNGRLKLHGFSIDRESIVLPQTASSPPTEIKTQWWFVRLAQKTGGSNSAREK